MEGNSNPSHSREVRRIGKVRMVWEELVSLWGEEGGDQAQQQRGGGRIRVEGCSFLNAEELTFFDESMVACTMESYDDGPLKGFSVDRFVSGQQIKVFGRRKSPSAASSSSFYTSTGWHHNFILFPTVPELIPSLLIDLTLVLSFSCQVCPRDFLLFTPPNFLQDVSPIFLFICNSNIFRYFMIQAVFYSYS